MLAWLSSCSRADLEGGRDASRLPMASGKGEGSKDSPVAVGARQGRGRPVGSRGQGAVSESEMLKPLPRSPGRKREAWRESVRITG